MDNFWTPKILCVTCSLRITEKKKQIFVSPTIWREPKDHDTDCYFCLTNTSGYNRKNNSTILYASVQSVTHAVLISIEQVESEHQIFTDEFSFETETNDTDRRMSFEEFEDQQNDELNESQKSEDGQPGNSHCFTQDELSDLVRDAGLSKEISELVASRLKEKNFLAPGTRVSFYRDRDRPFRKFFSKAKGLVYCNDVEGLINEYKSVQYVASDWRLFIDSSVRSLKAVLLHNGNIYAPIPVGHSVILKEQYNNLHFLLEKLKYDSHKWQLVGDLKITSILLGQQSGNTKYPCFICEWDSRAREQHYVKKDWPLRQELTPGSMNILQESLIPSHKVILPPLHIKLGLFKQLIKAMRVSESDAFMYIFEKFPNISEMKINEGVFDGSQIRELMNDDEFEMRMTTNERAAWSSFKEIQKKFLGNNKDPDYKNIADRLLENYRKMGCLMNLKIHFLHSHIDYFPENLGDFSEEQGERFHQDLKDFERRYQGVWDVNMMSDYCWSLKRDTSNVHKRKSLRRSFTNKRTRRT